MQCCGAVCRVVIVKIPLSQVTIRNLCTTSPITINGAVVAPGTALLEVGDTIEVLGHRFVWHKEDSPDTSIDGSLEASFQIGAYPACSVQFVHYPPAHLK